MIINTADFRDVCKTVLAATDNSDLSTLTETLELKTVGNILYLNTTNKEYYASVKFMLDHEEPFRAAVNANLFLKLIAAITTDTVELLVKENYLQVKANGKYKIPLIYENDNLMTVPAIAIQNPTVTMNISGSILDSIVHFNGKQLAIGSAAQPVQKMFYLDNEGCITFTKGACVNSFQLPQPIKVLLNVRLVNLFKLFKGEMIRFTLGYDPLSETLMQTKVSFETDKIKLVAITGCNDSLINQVPVGPIRARANKEYEYKVVFNTKDLSEAINRLFLFNTDYASKAEIRPDSTFKFTGTDVTLFDTKEENTETVRYQNAPGFAEPYIMKLDLNHLKKVIDASPEAYVTMNFGADHKCCVVTHNAIKNVIPQVNVRD